MGLCFDDSLQGTQQRLGIEERPAQRLWVLEMLWLKVTVEREVLFKQGPESVAPRPPNGIRLGAAPPQRPTQLERTTKRRQHIASTSFDVPRVRRQKERKTRIVGSDTPRELCVVRRTSGGTECA
jgi:hypothetical protein